MPRPITREDIKIWSKKGWRHFRSFRHKTLGYYIVLHTDFGTYYSYTASITDGDPCWCSKRTLETRKSIGHPAPRKKPRIMKDIALFSLDEMEMATKVMEGLS